ncbi:MAG: ATP-binding protein [Cyclobacteriaceae bacterium]
MRNFLKGKLNRILLMLLAGSFAAGFFLVNQSQLSDNQLAARIQQNIEKVLQRTDQEANILAAQLNKNPEAIITTRQEHHTFFLIKDAAIFRWTGNELWPPVRALMEGSTLRFIKSGADEFICKRYTVGDEVYLVAAIAMRKQYRIQNEYLKSWYNTAVLPMHAVQLLDPASPRGTPVYVGSNLLLKIQPVGENTGLSHTLGTTVLLIGVILACIVLYRIVLYFPDRPAVGFLILGAGFVVVRLTMLVARFPAQFTTLPLFDPKNYASSGFNPNLGDLLFNSVCVLLLCLYLFLNYSKLGGLHTALSKPAWRLVIMSFSAAAIFFGFLFPFVVIQTIYNNSAITLAISESISFNMVRSVALLVVLISWLSAFMFVHIFTRLLSGSKYYMHFFLCLLVGLSAFVIINESTGQYYWPSLAGGIIYLLAVIFFRLDHSLMHLRYASFGYFLVAIVAFSAVGYSAVSWFTSKERAQQQMQFASDFLLERDNFGEYLLDEVSRKIEADAFIQNRMSGLFINKEAVKQKIRQVFLPGYFNKYTIDLLLFGSNGQPLDDSTPGNFSTWLGRLDEQAVKTEYPSIYYINPNQEEIGARYISVIRIARKDLTMGFVVISLALRKVIPENVYPELLVDNRFQRSFPAQNYSYAVFRNHQPLFSSGEYNYDRFNEFGNPALFGSGVVRNGYHHLAIEDLEGRLAVVSAKVPSVISHIANFSFLLVCGLGLLMVFLTGVGISNLIRQRQSSFTERVQLILNLSFFIPLIAVSLITLGLTSRSVQEQLNAEYLSKSRNIAVALAAQVTDREAIPAGFEAQFIQQVALANLDANMFSPSGHLVVTTQPLIFEYQLLAPVISPQALNRIVNGDRAFVLQEQVGALKYYVAYSAVYAGASGRLLGILAIPYFQSQRSLEAMQITVLSNILIIFTLMFLLLLIVSFFASSWLTQPLSIIAQKIGRISLTESNQPIVWPVEDEIGSLVRSYNQMLVKLSESKLELERTQRERTWREIAQQVAHEIKNPLTPMKLTLQQLQRVNENDLSEKMKTSIASLLTQIDALDGIAASFSKFAKMPEPVLVPVDLVALLKETCDLHKQTGNVIFETSLTKAMIMADRQLLGSAVGNLILNGLQAERQDERVTVTVGLEQLLDVYRISISDNGAGIADAIRDRIFLPHFSTKQSGSGLGLAITRQGIEQMGGKIWFESEVGKGTRFYVQFPIMQG